MYLEIIKIALRGTTCVSPKALSDLISAIDHHERILPTREELSSGLRLLIRGGKGIELPGRHFYAGSGCTEYEHLTEEEFKDAVDQYHNGFGEEWRAIRRERGLD
jgi:hypothetical protein